MGKVFNTEEFIIALTRFHRLIEREGRRGFPAMTNRVVETAIGQLSTRFNIEKVWARYRWHLTSRLDRKLLAHTVCVWLNRHSLSPLQFEPLISE